MLRNKEYPREDATFGSKTAFSLPGKSRGLAEAGKIAEKIYHVGEGRCY